MEGQELVDRVARLGPADVLGYEAAARAGDPSAVAVLVARGAYARLLKLGAAPEQAKAALGAFLEVVTVRVANG